MTGAAVIHDTDMTECRRQKARGHVTNMAVFVGRHVVRRRRLAGRRHAVVTRCAVVGNAGMVEPGIDKRGSDMAYGTILRGRQVGTVLAGRGYTIVAGRAVVDDAGVIEYRRDKGSAGHMANVTVLGCRHMIGLRVLTGGVGTIVAGITTLTHDLGSVVIDKGIEETGGVMTDAAIPAGVLMDRRTRITQSTEQHMVRTAVMAGGTVTGDVLVGKYRGYEAGDCVAIVTVLRSRQMVSCLQQIGPGGQELGVVAAFTTPGNTGVHREQERRRCKYRR